MPFLQVVITDMYEGTAEIIHVEHGDLRSIMGKNIVAVVEGEKHDVAKCDWCMALAMRIESRVGVWG